MLSKSFNVLVVDDVILMSEFLYGVVSKIAGCRTFKCLDGRSAADVLENESIDLLITDIQMKAPTGVELAYKVRAGEFSNTAHDIPIIIFSGNTYLELIKQCISLDVNDFLAKPVNSELLTKKVWHHIRTEKEIRQPEYYRSVGKRIFALPDKENETQRKLNVFIVRNPTAPDDDMELALAEETTANPDKKDFLFWPENSTTGYFQLDRRLKNFAFKISCFHNVFVANCKIVAIEKERKKALDAIDYLFHITRNMKDKDDRNEFWRLFNVRMEKLKPLAQELDKANVRHHPQILNLLKKFSYWWMQTCNKPIIQKNEEPEVEDYA